MGCHMPWKPYVTPTLVGYAPHGHHVMPIIGRHTPREPHVTPTLGGYTPHEHL